MFYTYIIYLNYMQNYYIQLLTIDNEIKYVVNVNGELVKEESIWSWEVTFGYPPLLRVISIDVT